MKKLAFLAALLLIVLALAVFWPRPRPTRFVVGAALPPGKVSPQLVSTWDWAVLLAPDGSLWGWGGGYSQMPDVFAQGTTTQIPKRIGQGSDWSRIAASHMHMLALKSDGSLWGFGGNASGQLAQAGPTNRYTVPVRIGRDKWSQISVGAGHSLGLKTDGSLWAWGQNDRGQVGDGTRSNKFSPTRIGSDTDWKAIQAGDFNSFALKRDGTLWGWGLDPITGGSVDSLVPAPIDEATNWVAMSSGDYCLLALKSDGTLWLHGQNASSAAPDFASASVPAFVQVGKDTDWAEVDTGQGYFFARKRDGSWWVCGSDSSGELGLGAAKPITSPQRCAFDFDPWAFSCGYANTALLTRDGVLWTWGQRLGSYGNPRAPTRWSRFLKLVPNFLLRHFYRTSDRIIDVEPHWLWELPREVRRSLGTNREAQRPTNSTNGHE